VDDRLVVPALKVALDGLAQRQRISADNIANIQTPGFRARAVEFESALADAVAGSPGASVADLSGVVGTTYTTDAAREDGNNVSLEKETLLGTKTNLEYTMALRVVDNRFGSYRDVLRGA
jgi:flagellar basal-body rod protein FlgB